MLEVEAEQLQTDRDPAHVGRIEHADELHGRKSPVVVGRQYRRWGMVVQMAMRRDAGMTDPCVSRRTVASTATKGTLRPAEAAHPDVTSIGGRSVRPRVAIGGKHSLMRFSTRDRFD